MFARTLYLDIETYCETPIAVGTHRYAEDAEITVLAWAHDGGEVRVQDMTRDSTLPSDLLVALADGGTEVVMHNSAFDRTVLRHAYGLDIPVWRVTDTMVQALAHGLPGGLDKLCDVFKVPAEFRKLDTGRDLVMLFCKPRPKGHKLRRANRDSHPERWQEFLEYAKGDIRSMRWLRTRLPSVNYPTNFVERDVWCLDQATNDRGFAVDVELAGKAVQLIDTTKQDLSGRLMELTWGEVETAGQRDRLLGHLLSTFGVSLPDLTASTLERRVNDENLPEPVREILAIRLAASGSSTSKYQALLRGVSSDGRLRGTIQYCGASRTGRDAGRLFQPQNLPRTPDSFDAAEQEAAIAAIKGGVADVVYDSPLSVASHCLRGAIVASPGRKLVVADLSNIEGRVLAWLAGETTKLAAFRAYDAGTGPDVYTATAAMVLNKPVKDITKAERQTSGKVPELACGYQGGSGAFSSMMQLYGLDLTPGEVDSIVRGWRAANRRIVALWYDVERAARSAIATPGVKIPVNSLITLVRAGDWLRIRLPSGRQLFYMSPRLGDRREGGALSYYGVNSYTRRWERIETYGGKLVENITQAVARDVLKHNALLAEAAGYQILLPVHDELITETEDLPKFTAAGLCERLSALPDWADASLPLASHGFETYRYRKD
jgi:DNA polymerase